jgi:2-polyprenyl-6-methoxyphenol hydroxylase-like FAD-dependent oxidoreductase
MQPAHKTQIFIAGGGPVGLTAAIELRRRGFSPRIVDPDLEVSPQSRALAINPRTLDLLEPSGATQALLAAGHRIKGAIIRYNSQPLFTMNLGLAKHRFNFLLSLPQSETEKILEATLRRQGVSVERGVSLQSFHTGDGEINVQLSNGRTENADFLIGADGTHSTVRKALGFGFPGESAPQVFGLADVELNAWPFPWDMAVATIREDHVIAFLPMREGFGRFVSTRPDTMKILPSEARVGRTVWEAEFRINYRQVETYQKGNVFLAGDAAHIHSPVGGRGMNLGIEDACWLAWLIEQKRTPEYSTLRHPVGERVLKLTAQPTRLISSSSFTAKAIRRWVVPGLLGMDWVQRRILPGMLALDTPPPPWL